MKLKKHIIWAVATMLVLPLNATTYYVRSAIGNDATGNGTLANPFATFVKGLNNAVNGDTVNISGTFYDFSRTISKSITIQGTDKNTTIFDGTDGNAAKKPFSNFGTPGIAVTIENVTFQNYNSSALQCYTANSLTVKNSIFKNNSNPTSGGAIGVSVCTLLLEDCYFYNNSAKPAIPTSVGYGGAISLSSGSTSSSLTINRCLFESNTAQGSGGSALVYSASAVSGTASASLSIINSTFTGNTLIYNNNEETPQAGEGAININANGTGVDVKLINNTIAYNKSSKTNVNACAGLFIKGMSGIVVLINNILFSNLNSEATPKSVSIAGSGLKESRNNITDASVSLYNWLSRTNNGFSSGNISAATADQIQLDTSLTNNGGNNKTLSIGKNSIAAKAGYATGAPTEDQRNLPRVGVPDIGAVSIVKANQK